MDDECPKCPPEGLPAWMGTFADLMSLLMSFFVLLLSFSEMDVRKFKQIAGSMKFAFGVQNKIELKDIKIANQLDLRVKLLGISELKNNQLFETVHPCLVSKKSYIGNVNGVMNAVIIE